MRDDQLESWATGLLNKYGPDAVRVCLDIVQAGLRSGRASANDVRDVYFEQPNVIGAVFRACARRCGFRKANPEYDAPPFVVKSKKGRRHSGESAVWILAERFKAEDALYKFKRTLMNVAESDQGVLAL